MAGDARSSMRQRTKPHEWQKTMGLQETAIILWRHSLSTMLRLLSSIVRVISRRNSLSYFGLASLLHLILFPTAMRAEYRANLWAADDGLPQGAFRGFAQTSDGYLWISTLDGLARFDGVHFFLFTRNNRPGIVSSRFTGLCKGRGDDLWLLSEAGVTRYHNGSFALIYDPRRDYNSIVFSESSDEAGHIWIELKDRILEWDEASQRFVDITPPELRMPYRTIYWEDGGAWAYRAGHLYIFRRGRFHDYAVPQNALKLGFNAARVDHEGTIWLERGDGKIVSMRDGQFTLHTENVVIPYKDSNGNIWPIHTGFGFRRSVSYPSSNGTAEIPFNYIFEDREGSLWFAADGIGLFQMQQQLVHTIGARQDLATTDIYSLLQDREGSVWVGAWPGLFHARDDSTTGKVSSGGLKTELITALFEDRSGNLWIGSHSGLRLMSHGKLRPLPPGITFPEHALVQTIYEDRDGTMWFGTNGGLVEYRDGHSQLYTAKEGLTRDVNVIMQTASGVLWVGGYGCLARHENGHFTSLSAQTGLEKVGVWALYEDRQGILWIGTYDYGLLRLENDHVTRFNTRNGLFDDGAFQILEDTRGNLWMSSHRGIYRVAKQELNDVAAGRRTSITSIAYGKHDGMLTVECNGGLSPAGLKTRAGTMWFPTQSGVAVIDPDNAAPSPPVPQVVIESVTIDQIEGTDVQSVRLAPDQHALEVAYTAPSFIKSDQISFRYRLVGADSTWTDAGTRRKLYFSHLQPGKYVLDVIAANSDGVWNLQPRSLGIQVMAPFYRTPWFLTCLLLLIAALTVVMWRRRVSQLRRAEIQHRAFSQQLIASQESERKRIAAELHDTIGQRLIIINNLTMLNPDQHSNGDLSSMQEISTEALAALDETRQISYNLRPFQLDRLGLTKAIRALAQKASVAGRFKVSVEAEDIDNAFPEELRINFYRIVQEALNNIMKHAEATAVLIEIARLPKSVKLTIQDNGKGFAVEARAETSGPGGFGTTGMAERAALLSGTVLTESAVNQGTTIKAEFVLGDSVG
jgi:signal transduction histidine kinase/ligand-binding sensor domain-containing protein